MCQRWMTAWIAVAAVCVMPMASALAQDTPSAEDEAAALRAELAEMRVELARLKLEVDEALSRAEAAPAQPAPTPQVTEAPAEKPADNAATDADADAQLRESIEALSVTQARLDAQLDRLLAQQRQLEQRAPATHSANQTQINSPFEYQRDASYTITTDRSADRTVNAQYTTYSGGYSSGSYVVNAQPTTGPVIYTTPTVRTTYYNTWPRYYYPNVYRPVVYYPSYTRVYRPRYYGSGVSIRVGGDNWAVRYSTGYHGHHHPKHRSEPGR